MRTRRRLLRTWLALWLTALLAAPPAWSGPEGERVVSGRADVSRKGKRTKIRTSDEAIIEWDRFDIGRDEKVRFAQPRKRSRVLNRVTTPDVSRIEGRLKANGQVYIVNPEGVYFGDEAVVDVNRLVAVAGSLSDDDFLAGVDRFDDLGGEIENHGILSGDDIALVGKRVANHGRIQSPDGGILLVSGDEVWLAEHDSHVLVQLRGSTVEGEEPGVWNTGDIDAGTGRARLAAGDAMGLAIRSQGEIHARRIALEATGEDARVDVSGTLDARSRRRNGMGGRIDLAGDWLLLHDLDVDASGAAGGGRVRIGGDVGGDDSEIPRALGSYVASDVAVRADALAEGDGGSIVVWGDEVARVFGDLTARGGEQGGDGGFVETSGLQALDIGSAPDLSASRGDGGQWLIDPVNIDIVAGTGSLDDADAATPDLAGDAALFQSDKGNATVGNQVIVDALSSGTDVVITTERFGAEGNKAGDIRVDAPVEITDAEASGSVSFTLKAANDIFVGAPIRGDEESLGIDLQLLANNNFLMPFVDTTPPPGSTRPDGAFQPELGESDDVNDNAQFERGDVVVDAPIDTAGGALLVQGVNVDINQGLTTRGGVAVVVGTNPRVEEDRVLQDVAGDVTVGADIDARATDPAAEGGGAISVIAGGGLVLDAAASLFTDGDASVTFDGLTTDVQGDISSDSGLVTLGRGAGSVGGVALDRTASLTLTGDVLTRSGEVFAQGDTVVAGDGTSGGIDTTVGGTEGAEVELNGRSIDVGGPLIAGEGDVLVAARDDLRVQGVAEVSGASLDLRSGTSPTSDEAGVDLDVESGAQLQGDEIRLTAGDGVGGRETAQVEFREALLRSNSDPAAAPEVISVVQDGNLESSQLPTPDRIADGDLAGVDYTVRSAGGKVTIESADGAAFDGADLTLEARTAVDLQNVDPIAAETALIRSDQGFVLSESDVDPVAEGTDVLRVDRVTPNRELRIVSGHDGAGDLTFDGDVTLLAPEIRLRAGNGPSGDNEARVRLAEAAGTVRFGDPGAVVPVVVDTFVLRQDAAVADADVPAPLLFGGDISGLDLTIRSDADSVTLTDPSKVQDTDLTVLSNGVLELPAAIDVRSAELGKIGNFQVRQDLLDRIRYSGGDRSITLRAAVGGSGTLSFEDGVVVRGDEIRLVAGDNGESGAGVVDVRNALVSPVFQVADPGDPPAEFGFLLRQDSPVQNNTLPRAEQFVDMPDVYAVRSDESEISLSSLDQVPDQGTLVLDAATVEIQRDDGQTIDLGGGRNVELRAGSVRLESFVGDDEPFANARVRAGDPELVLADFDDDIGVFDFATRSGAPDEIVIRQEAELAATDLPVADAFRFGSLGGDDDEEAAVYTLASRQESIDLTALDPDQVNGSSLTLRLTPFAKAEDNRDTFETRTVLFPGAGRALELEDLSVDVAGALTLADGTSIDAEQTLSLRVGTAGQGGNLDFGSNVTLEAETIGFDAGDGATVNRGRPRSRVNAGEPTLQIDIATGADDESFSGFILQQDKQVSQENLPAAGQFSVDEGAGPVVGVETLDAYIVESREGSVKLDSFEDVNAQSVGLIASSPTRENATVRVVEPDGDLDFPTLLENGQESRSITLSARQVVLRSSAPGGRVVANDPRLVLSSGSGQGTAPRTVRIKQPSDLGPENGVSLLPGLEQFSAAPIFTRYQLVSTEGDVLVSSVMAPDLAFTDLRLFADDVVTVNIDRSDEFDEDAPNRPTTNFDLASLEVRADEIVLDTPVIEGGSSSIRTFGQQIFDAGQITLAEDTILSGRSVDFQGPVDASRPGGESLVIRAFGPVGIREDVGRTAPLEDLEIRYELNDEFESTTAFGRASDDAPLVVEVTDDILLNPKGRDLPADRASFFKADGDLTLRSLGEGTIDLGQGEKLSVVGNLTLESRGDGGTVRVSDLSARDTLSVSAHRIELVRRDDGPVRRPDGSRARDGGVDYNANELVFEFDEIGVAGPDKKLPLFGLPNPNDLPPFLEDPPAGRRFALAALSPDGAPLTTADFFRGERVLDIRPRGPSRADLSDALPGPVPRPRRPRPVESGVPPQEDLLEVGIDVRAETPEEHRQWLAGAAVYDDSGASRRVARVASRRIEADAAARSVDLFERLFGPERQNAARIRQVLQGAVDRYLQTTQAQRVVGFEFRRFVKNRPSSLFAAYQALEDLDALFRAHRHSGLAPAEYRRIQADWLEDIRPDGITRDELAEAIHPSRYVRGSDILDIFGQ